MHAYVLGLCLREIKRLNGVVRSRARGARRLALRNL